MHASAVLKLTFRVAPLAFTCALASTATPAADTWSSKNLYIFTGAISGPDGGNPCCGVIKGSDGNYYGTTWYGGTGGGVVFKVTPGGQETIVYAFSGAQDAQLPNKVIEGPDGNFYGTGYWGGGTNGYGIVFKVTPSGQETILQSFSGTGGGPANPAGALTFATDGNYYGTSQGGGTSGQGTFFRMTPAGQLTVVSSFGGAEGASPHTDLIEGPDGDFYGSTTQGGTGGYGTVFKVTKTGVFTVLHAFTGGVDGANPGGALLLAQDGHLYGTTQAGGAGNCAFPGLPNGCGTVFRVTLTGQETVLHSFTGYPTDGADPLSGLTQVKDGTLYGTTGQGGFSTPGNCYSGCGTIFSITPTGREKVLLSFGMPPDPWYYDGWVPAGTLLVGPDDTLIGATENGGGGWGNVIQIGPLPNVKLIATVKNVDLGGATELKWDATHATRCEASGAWSGGRGVKGAVRVVPAKTGSFVYTLTCFGPIGTGSATATVTVTP